MSKINALIQELQLKQKKIDYLNYIKDLLKGDQKCVDYIEVQDEVLSKLIPHIEQLAKQIEDGASAEQTPISGLTEDQVKVLAMVADKAKGKINAASETTPKQSNQNLPQPQVPKRQVMSNNDKMSFAMENRHLANREVQVANDQNMIVKGKVVGLDAPFVIVKTDTGPTIQVPIEKVSLQ